MATGWVGGLCRSRRFSFIFRLSFRLLFVRRQVPFAVCTRACVCSLHNNFSLRMNMLILKAVEGFRRGELRAPVPHLISRPLETFLASCCDSTCCPLEASSNTLLQYPRGIRRRAALIFLVLAWDVS